MTLEELNAMLEKGAPALFRALSPLGHRALFPKGIPFQASQARNAKLNGTIGQVTDGAGSPLPLPSMASLVGDLDPKKTFLYAPQLGHVDVRKAWLKRQEALVGRHDTEVALPVMTHGLTHGLHLVAELFGAQDATLILPTPHWGNYRLIFGLRSGTQIKTYPFYNDGRFNLEGLLEQIDSTPGKKIVILNFPANPTGYTPTPAEADAIATALGEVRSGPMVVVADDAYQRVVHEADRVVDSIFWKLRDVADPNVMVPLKIDGATKELMFFPSRIGFLTAGIPRSVEPAWFNKCLALVRSSAGSPPGPSQAMIAAALANPGIQAEWDAQIAVISDRYRALKAALTSAASDKLRPFPFNSAYFALVGLPEGIDANAIRQRLIEERSVGLISIGSANALRIAYCSATSEQLTQMVQHLAEVVADA